jgi:lipopolysaccharide heptosyltransferase II
LNISHLDEHQALPQTRLPFPIASELRHDLVAVAYAAAGALGRPIFRQRVSIEQLATARILILKPCCLGDVLFATPLVRELRRDLPGARLTFAVGRHSRPAIEGNCHVDDLLDTGAVGSGTYDWADYLALASEIRSRRFDVCFVLERSAALNLLPLLADIPIRIGIDSGGRGFSLSVGVVAKPARPESELYLDLLRAIGGGTVSRELEFQPSAGARQKIDLLVDAKLPGGRAFAVLHCGGGTNPGMALARKRWPVERFAELARRILASGCAVVLVGAEEDRTLTDRLKASVKATRDLDAARSSDNLVVDLVGQLSLDELAALAARASVYVGNDSGPTHLAEATGANVVMLFGPSDPIVYGPRSRQAVSVSAGLWCSPCFVDGQVAPCANVICLASIEVERVWREVAPHLQVRQGR